MTYGCHSRKPFKEVVETVSVEPLPMGGALDLQFSAGVVHRTWPNRFAQDCQYTKTALGKADPGCVGCKWREK